MSLDLLDRLANAERLAALDQVGHAERVERQVLLAHQGLLDLRDHLDRQELEEDEESQDLPDHRVIVIDFHPNVFTK